MSDQSNLESQPASTLGEYIRRARLAAGVDLSDLAREIRVPTEMLEHLEQGNYAKLPVDAYVRGYLNTICTRLELNRAKVLDWYAKESGKPTASRFDSLVEDRSPLGNLASPSSNRNSQLGVVVVVILLVIAFAFVIANRSSEETSNKEENSNTVLADSTVKASATDSTIVDTTLQRDSLPVTQPTDSAIVLPSATTETVLSVQCTKDSVWVNVRRIGGLTWARSIYKGDKARELSHKDTMAVSLSPVRNVIVSINGKSLESPATFFKVYAGQVLSAE